MAKSEAPVEELVGMIQRGELRLPEMQRQATFTGRIPFSRAGSRIAPTSRRDGPGAGSPSGASVRN